MRTIDHVSQGDIALAIAPLRHPGQAPSRVRDILSEAEAYDLLMYEMYEHEIEEEESEPCYRPELDYLPRSCERR